MKTTLCAPLLALTLLAPAAAPAPATLPQRARSVQLGGGTGEGSSGAPEIDSSLVVAGFVLLAGGALVLVARRRQRGLPTRP